MQIRAWRGVRFDPKVVGDPGACISPPYDVIDEALQEELYARSSHNIVRIVQGRREPDDREGSDVYSRAAATFRDWLANGVLVQEAEPSLYVYRQDFSHEGREHTRLGLVCLARLEEFGKGIMAHEKTLAGPKKDRLQLTRATGAQFGNIFALYDDPERRVDAILGRASREIALLEHREADGVTHRLHAFSAPAEVEEARAALRGRAAFIADGHHRYETALAYARENPELEAAQHVMLTLVNMRNEGLLILPTHRLVKGLEGFDHGTFLSRLEEAFDLRSHPAGTAVPPEVHAAMRDCMERRVNAFAIYLGDGKIHLATLRDPSRTAQLGDPSRSGAWRALDVTVLHEMVLKGILGIDEEALLSQRNVEYVKDIGDAVARARAAVDSGRCQALFLQNPPRMEEMKRVCEAGERMPQKSTFFHPKIYTGLVIHKMC